MRNSRQKQIIKAAVSNRYDHPTAAMVYATVHEIDKNISLGTVYRNLNQFVDLGEIRRITIPGGPDHFDWQTFPHSHFYCVNCGKMIDLDVSQTKHSIKKLESKYKFELEDLQLVGIGKCESCK